MLYTCEEALGVCLLLQLVLQAAKVLNLYLRITLSAKKTIFQDSLQWKNTRCLT